MTRAFVAMLVAFVCTFSLLASAQTYTIPDLGVLKGDNESGGFWINNLGDVVGCSDTQTTNGYPCTGLVPGQRAFYWSRATGMKTLGTLPGGVTSTASAINSSEIVVGQSDGRGRNGHWHNVLWDTSGKIKGLGVLKDGTYGVAFGVNDCEVVVGYDNIANNATHAVIWTSPHEEA